jgi:hypothetical protein
VLGMVGFTVGKGGFLYLDGGFSSVRMIFIDVDFYR